MFSNSALNYSILSQLYQVDTIGCQIDHEEESKKDLSKYESTKSPRKTKYEDDKISSSVNYNDNDDEGYTSAQRIDIHQKEKFRNSFFLKSKENI